MRRPLRVTLAIAVAATVVGAPIVFGANDLLDNPAAVAQRAVRLSVPADTPPETELAAAYELVELVNNDRVGRGLPAFEWHELLWVAANGHSTEMAANGVMRHQGNNGSDAAARITLAGFNWSAWGENLGAGYTDAGQLLAAWLNSPTHRSVLLGNFRYIGIAVVVSSTGAPYWTMNVAS